MTREQIEKAARIERENVHKELQENYRKHKDINLYTAFSATIDMYAVPLFKAGAQWRINSVWHDANEKPDKNQLVVFECRKTYGSGYSVNFGENYDLLKNVLLGWAYVIDLLPERKEETK